MKLKQIVIGAVMVLCAGIGIFFLIKAHQAGGADAGDDSPPENVAPVVSVQTGALKRMTLHRYVSGYGSVEPTPAAPDQPAAGGPLASPTAGIVARVAVVAGQHVNQGDVLVELNSGTVSFAFAKAEVERQKKLFADQNTSLKNLQDAEAQLASLEIRAPVSGTVTRISARAGSAVDANSVVAEVIDLDRLSVSAQIPTSDANELKTGDEVQIQTESPVTAALSFISPTVDTNDGTVLARAALPANSGLRPGQFVPLRIATAVHTNCLVAPEESVVTGDDGKTVIALVKGDEAEQVPVTAGFRENGWVEIEGAGLKEGDPVVTIGAYGFPDKAKIRTENSATNETSTNSSAAQ
jgi:membrane fusion protein (multidrug efflux system)